VALHHFTEGKRMLEAKETVPAIAQFNKALECVSATRDAKFYALIMAHRGSAHGVELRFDEARADCTAAIELVSKLLRGVSEVVKLQQAAHDAQHKKDDGDDDAADVDDDSKKAKASSCGHAPSRELEEQEQLKSMMAHFHFNRGLINARSKHEDEAKTDLALAVRLSPALRKHLGPVEDEKKSKSVADALKATVAQNTIVTDAKAAAANTATTTTATTTTTSTATSAAATKEEKKIERESK
jgi:hypothetical protein